MLLLVNLQYRNFRDGVEYSIITYNKIIEYHSIIISVMNITIINQTITIVIIVKQ